MKSRYITLFLTLLVSFFSFFGIMRHDVDEQKYKDLANEKQFDCVGKLFIDSTFNGSCVLISKKYILTAAHIFIESDIKPDTVVNNGNIEVYFKRVNLRELDLKKSTVTVDFNGIKRKVKKLLLHPNYSGSNITGTYDIAILVIEEPINDIIPMNLNLLENEFNSNVVGVGYGASGIASKPESVTSKKIKIAGENIVDSLGGEISKGKFTFLVCDFDHPSDNNCNKFGSAIPRPLEYMASGGDSGGGLFRNLNNKWELVGILAMSKTNSNTIMKYGYYSQLMCWTRVSSFGDWIKENTK